MFKKLKECYESWKSYKEAKKAAVLMIINQYNELLEKEIATKEAEITAYESMSVFGNEFTENDLKAMIDSINRIANSQNLKTEYFRQIHTDAHKLRMEEAKAQGTK